MTDRFVDNRDGTVTDTRTGLLWQESYAYAETGNYLTWFEARAYVDGLNRKQLGGRSDWRLPNKLELMSLYLLDRKFESRGRVFEVHIDPIFEFGYGSCFWTWQEWLSGALTFSYDRADIRWHPKAQSAGTVRAVADNFNPFHLLKAFGEESHAAS